MMALVPGETGGTVVARGLAGCELVHSLDSAAPARGRSRAW